MAKIIKDVQLVTDGKGKYCLKNKDGVSKWKRFNSEFDSVKHYYGALFAYNFRSEIFRFQLDNWKNLEILGTVQITFVL